MAWSVVRYDKENDTYATSVSLTYPLSGITDWQKIDPRLGLSKGLLARWKMCCRAARECN